MNIMNITLTEFVVGFERSSKGIQSLKDDWDSLDCDLQEEYASQIQWMLNARHEIIRQIRNSPDLLLRLEKSMLLLNDYRDFIKEIGVNFD